MESENTISQKNWYDKSYKYLLLIPALFLLFSIIYLSTFISTHGDIISKDVSLTGGTTISVFDSSVSVDSVESELSESFPGLLIREISDFRTGKQLGFFLETRSSPEEIKPALESFLGYQLDSDNSSIEFTGSALSEGFYNQLRFAIIIAFILMAIVVFFIFRTFVPSFAVILSAFADIIMTVTVVNLLGIELSTAGIIAFLMLIGYSVDTDILLTSRLLKTTEGTLNQRLYGAFKTGMTMTLTSIASVTVSLIIIWTLSDTLRQIFTILVIGLGFDIVNTWFTNAGILKWYVEIKEKKK